MAEIALAEALRDVDWTDRSSEVAMRVQRRVTMLFADLLRNNFAGFCIPPVADNFDLEEISRLHLDSTQNWNLMAHLPFVAPELFLPLGFDAVRFATPAQRETSISDDMVGLEEENIDEFVASGVVYSPMYSADFRSHTVKCRTCKRRFAEFMYAGAQYRSTAGVWFSHYALHDFVMPDADSGMRRSHGEWFGLYKSAFLELASKKSDYDASIVALPALWRPPESIIEPESLNIQSVIDGIAAEGMSLRGLHWRTLEELVAELLRAKGLKVHVTPRSGDGGRDIIALGELIPGEPAVLAVEVKQKPVVGLHDLRAALWANRQYPALLFATSGRFTAGVIREKAAAGNQLRLFLKDGLALSQWIDVYATARTRLGERG